MIARALRRLACACAALLLAGCGLVGALTPAPSSSPTSQPSPTPQPSPTSQPSPSDLPDSTALPSPVPSLVPAAAQYLVLVSLDGCRPDYFELADLPNLRGLLQSGSAYPGAWLGQLDSATAPGHTSMSTGSFPNRNGILSFNWSGPRATLANPTTPAAVQRGEMAQIVRASGVPTLAGLIKARYPDGLVASISATKDYAALALAAGPADIVLFGAADGSTLQPASLPGYTLPAGLLDDPRLRVKVTQPGEENLFAARAGALLVETVRPRALLLNFSATDLYGHSSGGKIAPSLMTKVMKNTDLALGELIQAYRQAGIFDQTLWVISADHGMIPNSHLIDPQGLEDAAKSAGLPGSGRAPYIFLDNPLKAAKLAEAIAAKNLPGIVAVYFRLELRDGASYLPAPSTQAGLNIQLDATYRYLLSTISGPTSPDVVLPTTEDAQLSSAEPDSSGAHGWITWGVQHIPLFLSGPGVRPGASLTSPARLVDLLPSIARLMGLPEANWDGLVLADALLEPAPADLARQAASNDLLQPLRDKLRSIAGFEN